ncbi:MAG: cobaltochelatase subunit CobN [Cyanobacteria bacterium J06638_20]
MHRLPAAPGGWTPESEGVVFIEQTPAPIVFLSAADTDILLLAHAREQLPADFPDMRGVNLLNLQQHLTIDTYAESVLAQAEVIVLRLLGGRAYWAYGLEVVRQVVEQSGAALWVVPGDDRPDLELMGHSTVPLSAVNTFWRYLTEGGIANMVNGLQYLWSVRDGVSDMEGDRPIPPPQAVPRVGASPWAGTSDLPSDATRVGILFYRAHYLAGNLEPIEALCAALVQRQLQPVPVFVSSLRDPDVQDDVLALLCPKEVATQSDAPGLAALINTTSFSLARLDAAMPDVDFWQTLDLPVIQAILSGGTQEQWETQTRGLSPRDVAMNVALPEVDGRIIGRAISFKAVLRQDDRLQTDVVGYRAVGDRIQWIADLARNWATLRCTPPCDRRIALILANYPTRDGRLANGVGLDTPASCVALLHTLQHAGYTLDDLPIDGDDLIQRLTASRTNDPESHLRSAHQALPFATYEAWFNTLPEQAQQAIEDRWGSPKDEWEKFIQTDNSWLSPESGESSDRPHPKSKIQNPKSPSFPIPGIQLGNIFIGIQPARGYDRDPALNYHAPDLEPTHAYLAFYRWLQVDFGAQAIAHIGKHGNLEWLPGKSVALSDSCYPEVALGTLPHLYPFIVNDPGEGSQAKRRAHAVILDHLTPPLTRAELYGPLLQLEALVDEYYEAQTLDPSRLSRIRERIEALICQENLAQDLQRWLGTDTDVQTQTADWSRFLTGIDACLCDLKEAQIRDGLHIFGQCPDGRQLRDLVVAIARHPGSQRLGLTRAIAQDWQLNCDPLTTDSAQPWQGNLPDHAPPIRTVGDVVEWLENIAADWVENLIDIPRGQAPPRGLTPKSQLPQTQRELDWIATTLLPALDRTSDEIAHFLHGLGGGYVPSGSSGAPTRGRPDVLPTGRNFYAVDIRALPTETAWDVGRRAAETLIERYTQENGDYPKTLGLSVWGTSTMRTGGDDMSEALALLGVRPVWDGPSRRVVDFEILPLSALGRPRIDVTLRISGFFRDAFPNLIDLFHQAVQAVADLPEPADQNPLRAHAEQDAANWVAEGLSPEQAEGRSRYRVFGSKPGAYGAGLQGLIDAQNWQSDADLARAYLNWSGYAYTQNAEGHAAPDAFTQRLKQLQVILHNQDNREHDLLDSDDYYQFQGGMTAAARTLSGQQPTTYFGDHSLPENPRIRTLSEELRRVYRSRVINPKWLQGVMRHGYKGAFEMAATVDYLFAYDATTRCVDDFMYQGIADTYLFDELVQAFVQAKNPWVLRDMAERLLEAHQRGMWQQVETATLDQLRAIANDAEAQIEGRSSVP